MSRPRLLADNDFNNRAVRGVRRREPAIEIARLREIGMTRASDDEVLAYAAAHQFVVVSHDVNTMSAAAIGRIQAGLPMARLLMFHQQTPTSACIDSLLLVWGASEAEEWRDRIEFLPY